MNKKIRLTLSIVLVVAIVVLAYFVVMSIYKPVKFEDEYNKRSEQVINSMKDIRTLEEQFRSTNQRYCSSIDSLIDFAQNGEAYLVKKEGTVPDNMTEAEAIKQGLLRRDTVRVNPLEKLYAEKKLITPKDRIKDLKTIPFSDGQQFTLQAGSIDKGGVPVSVFELTAPIETYTKGMDKQLVTNLKAELLDKENGFPGWKVGDMNQAMTDGNWE